MIKKLVGDRIKQLRNSQGYSQEKFANSCGLDRTYIASVEAGKRNISIENIGKITFALNISLCDFFNFDLPIHRNIILKINNEVFLLESDKELTTQNKQDLEIMCKLAFDAEASSLLKYFNEENAIENLVDLSVYEQAKLFQRAVNEELNINVKFKPIDQELQIITAL